MGINHPVTQLLMNTWDGDKKIEVDGVQFQMTGNWTSLEPGDTYVAGRNVKPKLLTAKFVKEMIGDQDQWTGCVYSVENAYPYDLNECYKVELTT